MQTIEYISKTAEETEQIAIEYAKTLKKGDIIALYGDLGVGKTVFARGILKGLGYFGIVNSPTFTIVNEYRIDGIVVAHFDMYRVDDEDSLETAGYYDYISTKAYMIIEWGERIEDALNDETIRVYIEGYDKEQRKIKIKQGS